MAPYMRNKIPVPIRSKSSGKDSDTTIFASHRQVLAIPNAVPLMCNGKISASTTQTTIPQLAEYATINKHKQDNSSPRGHERKVY